MSGRESTMPEPITSDVEAALAVIEAGDLRQIILNMLTQVDGRTHAQVVSHVIKVATRSASGWTPTSPSKAAVSEAIAFATAARGEGYADPSDVDRYLHQASNAFRARDYATALQIFAALLVPIGEVEIDLGQDETVEEVLGTDMEMCAAQYVVAIYMTTTPEQRAPAVHAAIDKMSTLQALWEPLTQMEAAAVEPLPAFEEFLPQWRTLIEAQAAAKRLGDWECTEDRWVREVIQRMAGAEGLEKLARKTKRADDLNAWCETLATAGDWQAALTAYSDAAELVPARDYARAEFLDGAALAAQELGRRDLPTRLERAWRQERTMLRLRRWLGSAATKRALRTRAAEALEECPKQERRQQALLCVLLHQHEAAAKILAAAPGVGWSDDDHPGQLLFQFFPSLLGESPPESASPLTRASLRGMEIEETELLLSDPDDDAPRIAAPTVEELVAQAGPARPPTAEARKAMLRALRKATKKRLGGVTKHKRRRYYGHAAELVATCVALDPTPDTQRWLAGIRSDYHRYPALKRELDNHLNAV